MIYITKNYNFNRCYYINDYLLRILSRYKFESFHNLKDLKKSTLNIVYIGERDGVISDTYFYMEDDNVYYLIEE